MKETAKKASPWFKLDNAAKIYPAVQTKTWASMYRISMTLDAQIDKDLLEKAVNDVLPRFPTFKVRMRKGFFWFYFEENDKRLVVQKEEGHPLMRLKHHENDGYLLRMLYYDCRISLEVFHALADGTGSMVFLKTIVARYLHYLGIEVPSEKGVFSLSDKPSEGETEDAHRRILTGGTHLSRKEQPAFRIPGTREMSHTLHVIVASMQLKQVKDEAKKYGVTLNEYMVAVLLFCLYEMQRAGKRDKKRPVKVSVPVNMRKFLPSETVRNFSFYTNIGIDPTLGMYSFEEIVSLTHHYLRYYMNPKFLFAGIRTNVASERNPIVRLFPLFVKNLVLAGVFRRVGERLCSTVLTNLGVLDMPDEMQKHVKDVQVLVGPGISGRTNVSMASFKDTLSLYFTRNLREANLEKAVCTFLVDKGIAVEVLSNQE